MTGDKMALNRLGPCPVWHLSGFALRMRGCIGHNSFGGIDIRVKVAQRIVQLACRLNSHVAGPLAAHQAGHPPRFDAVQSGSCGFDNIRHPRRIGLSNIAGVPALAFAGVADGDPGGHERPFVALHPPFNPDSAALASGVWPLCAIAGAALTFC